MVFLTIFQDLMKFQSFEWLDSISTQVTSPRDILYMQLPFKQFIQINQNNELYIPYLWSPRNQNDLTSQNMPHLNLKSCSLKLY